MGLIFYKNIPKHGSIFPKVLGVHMVNTFKLWKMKTNEPIKGKKIKMGTFFFKNDP